MKTLPDELASSPSHKRRLTENNLILFALVLLPFILISLLNWLNTFGYYLPPLFMVGLCPLGAITILAAFVVAINRVRKHYQNASSTKLWWLYIVFGIVGIIATVTFIWVMYNYTINTYMHG